MGGAYPPVGFDGVNLHSGLFNPEKLVKSTAVTMETTSEGRSHKKKSKPCLLLQNQLKVKFIIKAFSI